MRALVVLSAGFSEVGEAGEQRQRELVAVGRAAGIGPSVRDWVGDKQDTTRLGLTTLVLTAVAALAAAALRRPRSDAGGRRVAIALALVIPALVCFTTVGRLWYLPGALLLGAGALVLAGTRRRDFAAALDGQHWRVGLLVVCGAYYVFLGATARSPSALPPARCSPW